MGDKWESILVGLNVPTADPTSWRFFDEGTGQELSKQLVEAPNGMGTAWRIPAPHSPRQTASYLARYEGSRRDEHVPLVVLGAEFPMNGILLECEAPNLESTLTSRQVRRLDADLVASKFGLERAPFTGEDTNSPQTFASYRKTHALEYRDLSAVVDLRVKPLLSVPTGVVQLASLTTHLDPSGARRDRLVLRVIPDQASAFELTLPPDATLDRIRRDGLSITPARAGTGLLIPVNSSGANADRALVTLIIEYHANWSAVAGSPRLRPGRPKFSLPCIAFEWNLVTPHDWDVVDWGVQLVLNDPCRRSRLASEPVRAGGSAREDKPEPIGSTQCGSCRNRARSRYACKRDRPG